MKMKELVLALAFLLTGAVATEGFNETDEDFDLPDITQWECPPIESPGVRNYPKYGLQIVDCPDERNIYIKVRGELIYVHEHQSYNPPIIYNALKNNHGEWVEITTNGVVDKTYGIKFVRGGVELSIFNEAGGVLATRFIRVGKDV